MLRDQHYIDGCGRGHAAIEPQFSPFNQAVGSAAQRDANMVMPSFPMLYGLNEDVVAGPHFAPLAAAANQHVQSATYEYLDQEILTLVRNMQRG